MKKNYILMCVFAAGLSFFVVGSAVALDYTTKGSQRNQQQRENECSHKDKVTIKKYEKILQNKKQRRQEIADIAVEKGTGLSEREREDLEDELKKIDRFFKSENFQKLKVIFERCGLDIEHYKKIDPPFWMPVDSIFD